jgi:MEMO1 family protein
MIRQPVASQFYAGAGPDQIDRFLAGFTPPDTPEHPFAGIVPHAGWSCSGAVAAKVIATLRAAKPETLVLFGAVHAWGVAEGGVYPDGAWATPFGEVAVDAELAELLLDRCPDALTADPQAHAREHAIEVQVPMIKHLHPGAQIVPIAMPPSPRAAAVGEAVGKVLAEAGRPVAVLGSTDLTHYGPNYGFVPWGTGPEAGEKMRANDRRMIDLILDFRAEAVQAEAEEHANACGPGAIAATVAAAKAMGAAQATLVEYTTSHEVLREASNRFDLAVGYAGIVFG